MKMDPLHQNQLNNYEEDPILPLLDTFDTFSDLTFDFNNLIEEQITAEPTQSTLAYVNEILANQNNLNNKIISSNSNELSLLESFLNESSFEISSNINSVHQLDSNYSYSQSSSSNSGSPNTGYEQSTGTPELIAEGDLSLNDFNETFAGNSLEDECEKFLAENYDFGTADIQIDSIEVVVDTGNTCVDMVDSDIDSEDNSDCQNVR